MNLTESLEYFFDLNFGYFALFLKKFENADSKFLRDCCNDALEHSFNHSNSFCCFRNVSSFANCT